MKHYIKLIPELDEKNQIKAVIKIYCKTGIKYIEPESLGYSQIEVFNNWNKIKKELEELYIIRKNK